MYMHFLVMQKPKYTIPYHYDMYNVQCNSIYESTSFLEVYMTLYIHNIMIGQN